MPRTPKPWWRKDRASWFVTINGKRHNLGPNRELAHQEFHRLMTQPKRECVQLQSTLAIMDAYLDWTQRHRAPRTYTWYRDYCQSFADTLPHGMPVHHLKPWHVQSWLDKFPHWNGGHRRGAITAIQRVFRWAEKMGYIDRSPIAFLEKPPAGNRNGIISPKEYAAILANISDDAFRDVVITVWETGCRPQEVTAVEARHVDLANSRWVFPPPEAKVKSRPRVVYLPDQARAITERLVAAYPIGPLFRNRRGRPWTAMSINCRFNRLKETLGRKYCLYLFRHSFATRMLEAGVDALTVAILLGHANPAMLSITYQHLAHNPQFLLDQARRAS
jgi:integrase